MKWAGQPAKAAAPKCREGLLTLVPGIGWELFTYKAIPTNKPVQCSTWNTKTIGWVESNG